ncbi:hypothetical protein ABGB16_11280 [Micromonospora sp. B11E3]|uniref:hypothetical protein n=1 Tax=Micromonospora sp. B11E3 TaxID=3153562 RepID=UPI00325E44B8
MLTEARRKVTEALVAYDPIPLPRCASRASHEEVAADVHRWATSPPLRDLVTAFGGAPPPAADGSATAPLLAWLDDFSAGCWNFRGGAERYEARAPELDAETAALVVSAAEALGLVHGTGPLHDRYHHMIVLGGLARACLHRTSYAAALLTGGLVGRPEVAALGSFRPLTTAEHALLAERGAAGCRDEMDALDAGVRRYLGLREPASDESDPQPGNRQVSWRVRTYRREPGPTVRVLAAPSGDAGRRANTADTQRYWAELLRPAPGDRVLVVTSAVYVPFQHADAIRTLGVPLGVDVDTVGVEARWSPEAGLHQPVAPGTYLQELRSAIRSMRALHDALSGGRTRAGQRAAVSAMASRNASERCSKLRNRP